MSKTKALRRSLLASVVSLATCATMFVGTTFAWFTDSVSSQNNLIVSGNLDVELEYLDANDKWQPVTKDTNVFMNNTLWEPGHTEVVYLKVSNVGSLALNYKLGVNIVEEIESVNVNGDDFRLSQYIMMGAVEGVKKAYDDRMDARDALDENKVDTIYAGYVQEGVLFPKNNMPTDITDAAYEEYVALVVYMPEEIGNEANYRKGEAVPKITLGINLLATQYAYEKDSFGPDYDKDANTTAPPVPSETEIIPAIEIWDLGKTGYLQGQSTLNNVEMVIYDFVASHFADAYPVDEYKDWTCDFFVSTDKGIQDGVLLAGNYGAWGWIGFWAPANNEPYKPTPLLGSVSNGGISGFSYEDIATGVQEFRCGIIDYGKNNKGVTATVELRMTSPDGLNTITASRNTVTF